MRYLLQPNLVGSEGSQRLLNPARFELGVSHIRARARYSLVLQGLTTLFLSMIPASTPTFLPCSLPVVVIPTRVPTPTTHPRARPTLSATSTPILFLIAFDGLEPLQLVDLH
jgi:hypothetical protein